MRGVIRLQSLRSHQVAGSFILTNFSEEQELMQQEKINLIWLSRQSHHGPLTFPLTEVPA